MNSRISGWNLHFNAVGNTPDKVCAILPRRYQTFAETESIRKSVEEQAYSEPNWDGYNALAISSEAKRNALTALRTLELSAPAPSVIANPNGTLSFEWETDHGIGHLEIGRTRYSFYVRPNFGRAILADGDANEIGGFLGTFVEGILYPKPPEPVSRNPKFLASNV